MQFQDWRPTYEAILAQFGYHQAEDEAAARQLDTIAPKGGWRHVGTELKNRPRATVVGCGPALEELKAKDLPEGVVVAADGAATRLMEIGVVPRVVVTDLDGPDEGLAWAAAAGASIVVHAHGHNTERLDGVPDLGPLVAGSCQCDPTPFTRLQNHGGFTDGDRAVLLCEALRVRRVDLVAFDFAAHPSRYSGTSSPRKPEKLQWAQRIIQDAAARGLTVMEQ